MMLIPNLLLLLGATTALAAPALSDPSQLRLGGAGQAALNWGAGAVSRIGAEGGVDANTIWSWTDCGEAGDAITIKKVSLKPDPPVPGKELTIYADGVVNNLIDEGSYADVVVKLGLIKLLTKRFDICEELVNGNATLQCPIKEDKYSVVQSVDLPEEIPRAKFVVDVKAFTQTEQPLACLSLMINFLVPDAPPA